MQYNEIFLTDESVGSGESVKHRSGDPIRGKNFFFPVSSCQTTRTPSFPPGDQQKNQNKQLSRGNHDRNWSWKSILALFHLQLQGVLVQSGPHGPSNYSQNRSTENVWQLKSFSSITHARNHPFNNVRHDILKTGYTYDMH